MFASWTTLDVAAAAMGVVCVLAAKAVPFLPFREQTRFGRFVLSGNLAAVGFLLLHGKTHLGGPGSW